jgi:hypothetical protein
LIRFVHRPKERRQIARKAALTRWRKRRT